MTWPCRTVSPSATVTELTRPATSALTLTSSFGIAATVPRTMRSSTSVRRVTFAVSAVMVGTSGALGSSSALWPQDRTAKHRHETTKSFVFSLSKFRSKDFLQIRERELQIERRLQRLAPEIAQAALRVEQAEHRGAAGAVAFFGERLQVGGGRHEALLVRLHLPPRRVHARERAVYLVFDGPHRRLAPCSQLRGRRDRRRYFSLVPAEKWQTDADAEPRADVEVGWIVEERARRHDWRRRPFGAQQIEPPCLD